MAIKSDMWKNEMNLLACCGDPFEKLDDVPSWLDLVLNLDDKNDLTLWCPLLLEPFWDEPFWFVEPVP